MSDAMVGHDDDEAYAGACYYHFERAIQDVLGFEYVLPLQGRAASMLFAATVKAGQRCSITSL